MTNPTASQTEQMNFEMFCELCWRIHLRDGGTVREAMDTALEMMVETAREMVAKAEGGN